MSERDFVVQAEHRAVDMVRITLGAAGLVAIVLGAVILFNPDGTGTIMMSIIASIFAVLSAVVGLVYLAVAIFSRTLSGGRRFGRGLIGLIWLAAGIVIFVYLTFFADVLAAAFSIIIGIGWLVEGVFALVQLKESRSKAFSVIYGIISIAAGGVLVFWPLLGFTTLWILLGASMLVIGVLQLVRAFTVKHDANTLIV